MSSHVLSTKDRNPAPAVYTDDFIYSDVRLKRDTV